MLRVKNAKAAHRTNSTRFQKPARRRDQKFGIDDEIGPRDDAADEPQTKANHGETGGFGQPDNAVVHGEFAAASSTSIAVAGTHVDGFLAAKKIEKNEKNEQEDEDDEPVTEHIPSPPLHFESNVIKILNRLT